jgi:hypothetical protein
MISDIERAEQKGRARALCMGLLALVTAFNSTLGFDNVANDAATFRGGTWLITIALCLMVLLTGGGLMLSAQLRALMNDERTIAHRAKALATGFFAAILIAAILYVVSWSAPVEPRAALRLVTGLSLSTALARFALLEWF